MIIIILLSLILFVILHDYYLHRTKSGQLIDLIPGPPHIPIFGVTLLFRCSHEEIWRLICYFTEMYPVARMWFGPVCNVFLSHPDDFETILSSTKHINKSMSYEGLRPWLNDGLLLSGGSKWHIRRKILTPTFHFNILQQFAEILIEESNLMVKSLKDVEGPITKDLIPFLSEHTLNAICETAMGTSLHSYGNFKNEYRKSLEEMSDLFMHRITTPWLYSDFTFAISPSGRKQAKILKVLHGFTEKIIKERKLYHEHTDGRHLKNIDSNISAEIDDVEVMGSRKKRLALLDLLIAASRENTMTDLDIREEVDTFMFEGHDTTAMSVCFILMLLAEHKDIQDCVRTEIDDIIEENGRELTVASLQKLSYLERCLKEALRLYPSVPIIGRVLSEDIKCQSYTVPADTILILNIYNVHRDPKFWPNPDVFDPDRFLPDQVQNRHPYSYIPFSAGPRNCIGQRFALLELKAIVASLVHNFYLEPVSFLKDLQIKADLILRPAHPVCVKFVPISNEYQRK